MTNLAMKQNLDTQQLAILQSELDNQKKSTTVAYLLWFFLDGLGIHRFYISKVGSGVTMLILFIVGWLLTVRYVGFLILIAFYIWVLIDAFLLHYEVKQFNLNLERKILLRVANS